MRQTALLTASAVALAVAGVLATGLEPPAIAVGYVAAVTPWLVAIDIREHRLPNALVLPGIAVGLATAGWQWIAADRSPLVPLVAGAGYAAILLLLHVIGGMGLGDVKLGACLGLACESASVAVLSPLIAFLAGGLVATVLLIAGRRGRAIAFGPYLLGGFWVAIALQALATA